MIWVAVKFGGDPELWAITGLVHYADHGHPKPFVAISSGDIFLNQPTHLIGLHVVQTWP